MVSKSEASDSYQEILTWLQERYPGQLVLFPEQIAETLASTPAAVRMMRHRNSLPLTWKKVGHRRGVRITDYARWYVSDDEPLPAAPPPKRARKPRQQQAQDGDQGLLRPSLFETVMEFSQLVMRVKPVMRTVEQVFYKMVYEELYWLHFGPAWRLFKNSTPFESWSEDQRILRRK